MQISNCNVVFEFDIDNDIVLSLGSKIKEIQNAFNAKVQMLNVPKGAPPEVPRVILIVDGLVLTIALNRFSYVLQIPVDINNDVKEVFKYIFNKVKDIDKYLRITEEVYRWTGVVTNAEYPSRDGSKNSLDMVAPLFDKMIDVERNGRSLASFNLQFGFQEDGYFKNYTISGYDTVNVQMSPAVIGNDVITLNKDDGEVIESGVSIVIDINNRPAKIRKSPLQDFSDLIEKTINTIFDLPKTLKLGGILNESTGC